MEGTRPTSLWLNAVIAAVLLTACLEGSQSPPASSDRPLDEDDRREGMLGPLDLIYVCGNRFLATNSTDSNVEVEYRVLGTSEAGHLSLRDGSEEHSGFSETDLRTRAPGPVELYRDGERVARRRNEGRLCGAAPFSGSIAGLTEAESGSWDAPFTWVGVAIHMSLLPTGKVLSFGSNIPPQVWDPATGNFTAVPSPIRLFCSGHSFLADGRLLVAGGHIATNRGFPDITIFDPVSETWSRSTPMRRGRWYPTVTTLGSGDAFILFGTDEAAVRVDEPEIWSAGALRVLPTATFGTAFYPRTFLAPNGKVFDAGDAGPARYLDHAGTGTWNTVATRLYGKRDYGAAVMYDVGKVMYVGGARTTNTAEIIDLNSAAPAWQWTGAMAFPRRHLNATVLPTGEILVTGGTGGTAFNDLTQAVRAAEIWSPETGNWTILRSNAVARGYHSTSILLPDGRVLHAGSGNHTGSPDELSAEFFSPPYLFKGPRPTISAAPSLVGYGTSFRVNTPQASTIDKVSLIRLGSTTHAFDMNQRFQRLSFSRQSGSLTITAPTSHDVTPPGHYMLFLLSENGVPSVAKIVQVGSASEPDPPSNASPTATFQASCNGLTCAFTDGSTDGDGTVEKWSWDFGDGESSTERHPDHAFAAAGPYEVKLTVTDDGGATGTLSKTITVAPPPPPAAPVASFTWSCTGFTCTFTDGSTDEGSVTVWAWDFGDNTGTSSEPSPTYTYALEGPHAVTLTVTDNTDMTGTASQEITVTPPPPNKAPTAAFTSSCSGLTCTFTDGSTDGDGTVEERSWDFGDGSGSAVQNPGHTYGAAGPYGVTLIATDDNDATATVTQTVTVAAPPSIALSVTGRVDTTKQYMVLRWSGAQGASVDVYRNGVFLKTETNDGVYTNSRSLPGATQYTYKVCQVGTTVCSNEATVQFGAAPSSIVLSVTGRVDATKKYMALKWSGAQGASVAVYRNGVFLKIETNDGVYTNSLSLPGANQYTYKVCQAGTTVCSNEATVQFAAPSSIVLSVTGSVDATKQYMALKWSGAQGASVDVYRNGVFLKTDTNDGKYTNSRSLPGANQYTYKVCQAGTTVCSNNATVTFP